MANGEGSRGGHITGHTKAGKPIYGDHKDTAAKVDHGKPHSDRKPTAYENEYKKAYDKNGGRDIGADADQKLRKKFGTKSEL